MQSRINISNIEEAYQIIDKVFLNSPQYEVKAINEKLNCSIIFKIETMNPIRSFKGRGASYYVSKLQKGETIVCASAGNLGQALAYICEKQGVEAIIFASTNANKLKIEQMKLLGAKVNLVGADFDEAKTAAKKYAMENNYHLLEDSLDIETCEGAGTIAKELLKYSDKIDMTLIALGNGAMLTGIGAYLKEYSPITKVVGVVAKGAPAMADSFEQKKMISYDTSSTIADGIAVRKPIKEVLVDMEIIVDKVFRVDDKTTIEAMKIIHEDLGLVVEPSGAICLAAILENKEYFKDKTIAVVICGGNLSVEQMKQYL